MKSLTENLVFNTDKRPPHSEPCLSSQFCYSNLFNFLDREEN